MYGVPSANQEKLPAPGEGAIHSQLRQARSLSNDREESRRHHLIGPEDPGSLRAIFNVMARLGSRGTR